MIVIILLKQVQSNVWTRRTGTWVPIRLGSYVKLLFRYKIESSYRLSTSIIIRHCGYFPWFFKLINRIINSNFCNWILIFFLTIWRLFFGGFSRFLVYSSSVSRRHIVSGLLVKCHINFFIVCVVTKWNLNRYCK